MSRTRIVCTIGPATTSEEKIRALIHAGMNVARINFSHGTRPEQKERVDLIRRIAAQENAVIAILGDFDAFYFNAVDNTGFWNAFNKHYTHVFAGIFKGMIEHALATGRV